MPRLTEKTRAQRRQHILTSAWTCFSRDGFHATSMDQVIAESGMSSSAVYRYFGSKEEIIHASAEEGVARVRGIFLALLDRDPCPTPPETLTLLVAELRSRTDNPDYDMTRLALQTWAEALRDPVLQKRARTLYLETLDHIAELAGRWRKDGYIPPNSDTNAVAATLFSLMHGLIVMHHLVDDVPSDALRSGLSLLGAAVVGPYTLPATPKQEATP
jgi:AcrR family transcriptional regulator